MRFGAKIANGDFDTFLEANAGSFYIYRYEDPLYLFFFYII